MPTINEFLGCIRICTRSRNSSRILCYRRRHAEPRERTLNLDLGDGFTKAYTVGPRGVFLHGRWVDNRWVVPCCPFLTLRYDAHINVEICYSVMPSSTSTSTCSRATIDLGCDRQPEGAADKITNFVEARCLGSRGAAWSIFAFPITKRS